MGARELLQAGQLTAAIDAATQDVKQAPGDVRARIFLFELLAATGQWERAQKHLDVVGERAPDMQDGILSYGGVLDAERLRATLFTTGDGELTRMTLAPVSLEPQLAAVRHLGRGQVAEAQRLLDEAAAAHPPLRGTADGTPFEGFRDADDLLGPMLEVIARGRYGWIPLAHLRAIEIEEPQSFRDLLWIPASLTMTDDSTARMFVPVRYPGSETHPDDQVKLGRATDWLEGNGPVRGVGQRAFLVGDDLRYLLAMRRITFEG